MYVGENWKIIQNWNFVSNVMSNEENCNVGKEYFKNLDGKGLLIKLHGKLTEFVMTYQNKIINLIVIKPF